MQAAVAVAGCMVPQMPVEPVDLAAAALGQPLVEAEYP
jgi:hypothetical protein